MSGQAGFVIDEGLNKGSCNHARHGVVFLKLLKVESRLKEGEPLIGSLKTHIQKYWLKISFVFINGVKML